MLILTPQAKYKFKGRDNDADDMVVVRETWIEDVYQLHRGLLDDQGIFIDIGANIGSVSVYAASLADDDPKDSELPKIKVLAYEPQPDNFALLEKNIKLNKLSNIKAYQKAILGYRDTVNIENNSGGSQINGSHGELASVEAITIQDIFNENKINYADVLKIDVEGAEYNIIEGTPVDLLTHIRHLRMEFHDTTDEKFGSLVSKLAKVYNLHIIGKPELGGNIYGDLL